MKIRFLLFLSVFGWIRGDVIVENKLPATCTFVPFFGSGNVLWGTLSINPNTSITIPGSYASWAKPPQYLNPTGITNIQCTANSQQIDQKTEEKINGCNIIKVTTTTYITNPCSSRTNYNLFGRDYHIFEIKPRKIIFNLDNSAPGGMKIELEK